MLKLLELHGFQIQNDSTSRYTTVYCTREDVCLVYHEWPQFGDFNIFVCQSIEAYSRHRYLRTYDRNWLIDRVSDKDQGPTGTRRCENMRLVELYLHDRIKNRQDIFEIPMSYERD